MTSIRFFKMEGAGNDYIYVDARASGMGGDAVLPAGLPLLCDRRYGVGSDGLVMLTESSRADVRMWMWNADGSSSATCGNALRCVALYVSSMPQPLDALTIESGAGVHRARILSRSPDGSGRVCLDMGPPILDPTLVPFAGDGEPAGGSPGGPARFDASRAGSAWDAIRSPGYVVSMGNPHCVFFVDDPDSVDIETVGPAIEHDVRFPQRTNVEFVAVRPDGSLYQRTWERGSGETLACGSGACAVLVAAATAGLSGRRNIVHLRGGDLEIEWNGETVWMTGPARLVFVGEFDGNVFRVFRDDAFGRGDQAFRASP